MLTIILFYTGCSCEDKKLMMKRGAGLYLDTHYNPILYRLRSMR